MLLPYASHPIFPSHLIRHPVGSLPPNSIMVQVPMPMNHHLANPVQDFLLAHSGGIGYPQLPVARVLPHASPTSSRVGGSSGSAGTGNKVPIDEVIDHVTTMGFPRDHVRATIRKLTDNGQAVDVNVVLDKLMNDGEVQPPRGWFGRNTSSSPSSGDGGLSPAARLASINKTSLKSSSTSDHKKPLMPTISSHDEDFMGSICNNLEDLGRGEGGGGSLQIDEMRHFPGLFQRGNEARDGPQVIATIEGKLLPRGIGNFIDFFSMHKKHKRMELHWIN
ncbi:unnamed protein product [Prunus brigantina]